MATTACKGSVAIAIHLLNNSRQFWSLLWHEFWCFLDCWVLSLGLFMLYWSVLGLLNQFWRARTRGSMVCPRCLLVQLSMTPPLTQLIGKKVPHLLTIWGSIVLTEMVHCGSGEMQASSSNPGKRPSHKFQPGVGPNIDPLNQKKLKCSSPGSWGSLESHTNCLTSATSS